eukprot:6543847-Karenia_brevis.AAC.1
MCIRDSSYSGTGVKQELDIGIETQRAQDFIEKHGIQFGRKGIKLDLRAAHFEKAGREEVKS